MDRRDKAWWRRQKGVTVGLMLVLASQTWQGSAETLPNRERDPQWVRLLPAPTAQLPKLAPPTPAAITAVKPSPPVPVVLPPPVPAPPPAPAPPPLAATPPLLPATTPGVVESSAAKPPAVPKDTAVPDIDEEEAAPPGSPCAPGANAMAPAQGGCTPFYRWQVQVLAGRALPKMKASQRDFNRQHRKLLEGLELIIKKVEHSDEPLLPYRLRVVPLADGEAARAWCEKLKARQKPKTRGADCMVVRSRTSVPSPEIAR
ncbi:hypothetical protein CCP4SC76_2020039 [Gammaproteobacteria bacterium]